MPDRRMFLLYDGRARSGSTDDAQVLDTAATEKEARNTNQHWPEDAIWFEALYDERGEQTSERVRYDLSPKQKRHKIR